MITNARARNGLRRFPNRSAWLPLPEAAHSVAPAPNAPQQRCTAAALPSHRPVARGRSERRSSRHQLHELQDCCQSPPRHSIYRLSAHCCARRSSTAETTKPRPEQLRHDHSPTLFESIPPSKRQHPTPLVPVSTAQRARSDRHPPARSWCNTPTACSSSIPPHRVSIGNCPVARFELRLLYWASDQPSTPRDSLCTRDADSCRRKLLVI